VVQPKMLAGLLSIACYYYCRRLVQTEPLVLVKHRSAPVPAAACEPHRAITPSSVIRNSVSRVGEQGPRSHCTFRWRLVRRDSWHPASKGSEWVLASLREGEEAAGRLDV